MEADARPERADGGSVGFVVGHSGTETVIVCKSCGEWNVDTAYIEHKATCSHQKAHP